MRRLYIMDLPPLRYLKIFLSVLAGILRTENRKKNGGIKAHTIFNWQDSMLYSVRHTESDRHEHVLLKDVDLPEHSFICFDKGYVNYAHYEVFTSRKIWFVSRLKDNGLYQAKEEYNIN